MTVTKDDGDDNNSRMPNKTLFRSKNRCFKAFMLTFYLQ